MAEHHQVPLVASDLGFGAGQRPAGMGAHRGAQRLQHRVDPGGHDVVGECDRLLAAELVTPSPQVGLFGLDAVEAAALLQPDQHLGDHRRCEPPEADLSAPPDRRLGQPPPLLVEVPVLPAGAAEPELVGLAVEPVRVTALLHTGDNRARPARSERPGRRMPAELGHANPERVRLIKMRSAQSST